MRIGIFTDAYYPQISGVVTSVITLRCELQKLGHEVFIITVSAPKEKINKNLEIEQNVIRIPSVPYKKWKELRIASPFYVGLGKKIKDLNLDIIHTQTEFTVGTIGKKFARKLDIPLVHTYHTMYVDYVHYIYAFEKGKNIVQDLVKTICKTFLNSCDAIIAPTKKTETALLSYGVKRKIFVLPTGIDINHFGSVSLKYNIIKSIKEEFKIDPKAKILLFLGRLSEEKSLDFIIKVFPDLLKKQDNIVLLIVGDGPDKDKMQDLSSTLLDENKIIFTGAIPYSDVPYYYSMADVFVNASKTETQGLTIMEAMAAKLPIVIYNDENISEHIEDGVSGRLFDNEEDFINKVISALNDKKLNEELIDNGCDVVNSLSKENFAINAVQIYEELIKDKSLGLLNTSLKSKIKKNFKETKDKAEDFFTKIIND